MRRSAGLWIAITFFAVFVSMGQERALGRAPEAPIPDRIVIPAPLQLVLYGGDRFLAADLEMIRAAALGVGVAETDIRYLLRLHRTVAQLNPCHEDNYYVANSILSWGGAVEAGNEVLESAIECRHWDPFPAFFFGFNKHYFEGDTATAVSALKEAASRSSGRNAAAFEKLAIMFKAGDIKDDEMALAYLRDERESAKEPRLRQMLDKRIARLEGLIRLRKAQQEFEARHGRPLQSPQELLDERLLDQFPQDPLGLGYQFENGTFQLKGLNVTDAEKRP